MGQQFHGSYKSDDCTFLLTSMKADFVSIEEKERRIQSGAAHYSEMIHREPAPSSEYTEIFESLTNRYAGRMASEVQALARQLLDVAGRSAEPIVLVSLVRAGTPVGALLKRAFSGIEGQACEHYSISIIRDRGIDENALDYILDIQGTNPDRLFFIDAWTAKGVITAELRTSVAAYSQRRVAQGKAPLAARLAVLSDIGGTSDYAASCDDYAIPCGVLNATVSGLVSRSILNDKIGPDQYHGCVYYEELEAHDRTNEFLDRVSACFTDKPPVSGGAPASTRLAQGIRMQHMIDAIMSEYGVTDVNHIKPGIAEATRVMLRRVPAALIVKSMTATDIDHLLLLAHEKKIPVHVDSSMPFNAVSLIQRMPAVMKARA